MSNSLERFTTSQYQQILMHVHYTGSAFAFQTANAKGYELKFRLAVRADASGAGSYSLAGGTYNLDAVNATGVSQHRRTSSASSDPEIPVQESEVGSITRVALVTDPQ